ncbi:LamG-like jellyroll fold domain-containing protein, partial [Patescibacteria group bacterium]
TNKPIIIGGDEGLFRNFNIHKTKRYYFTSQIRNQGRTDATCASKKIPNINEWNHVCITSSNFPQRNQSFPPSRRIYVNGVDHTQESRCPGVRENIPSALTWAYVTAIGGNASKGFVGAMDEVMAIDNFLTEDQVASIANRGNTYSTNMSARSCEDENCNSASAWYPCPESSGGTCDLAILGNSQFVQYMTDFTGCKIGGNEYSSALKKVDLHYNGTCETTDADRDGYYCDDCDDNDPDVHPGAEEAQTGRDENCNGIINEGFGIDVDYDNNTVTNEFGSMSFPEGLDRSTHVQECFSVFKQYVGYDSSSPNCGQLNQPVVVSFTGVTSSHKSIRKYNGTTAIGDCPGNDCTFKGWVPDEGRSIGSLGTSTFEINGFSGAKPTSDDPPQCSWNACKERLHDDPRWDCWQMDLYAYGAHQGGGGDCSGYDRRDIRALDTELGWCCTGSECFDTVCSVMQFCVERNCGEGRLCCDSNSICDDDGLCEERCQMPCSDGQVCENQQCVCEPDAQECGDDCCTGEEKCEGGECVEQCSGNNFECTGGGDGAKCCRGANVLYSTGAECICCDRVPLYDPHHSCPDMDLSPCDGAPNSRCAIDPNGRGNPTCYSCLDGS